MRYFSLLLSVLLLSAMMSAQEKYLVAPNAEVLPYTPGKNAMSIMKAWEARRLASQVGTCSDKFKFGYDTLIYPITSRFGGYHKDVFGQWFEIPASGLIDTVWFRTMAEIGVDSTLSFRIHSSVVGPDYGPGIRPGPYDPPCLPWGYYINTNDLDRGVAPFIEQATGPWYSTVPAPAPPTVPPFAEERWGYGGFPLTIKPSTAHYFVMDDLVDTVGATAGEVLFFSLAVPPGNTPTGHLDDEAAPTRIAAADWIVATDDIDYPGRMWKFYEHDSGPSPSCGAIAVNDIPRGWIARGITNDDTLDVMMFNIWYAMSVTTNVPPTVISVTNVGNTFSTGSQTVTTELEDCNPADPFDVGVATALLRWSLDGVQQSDIPLVDIGGGTIWEADLPGQPIGSSVSYRVVATDLQGMTASSPGFAYRVVPFGTQWYSIDTGYSCTPQSIKLTGTEIDTSDFFTLPDPPYEGAGTAPMDDGAAGPFDMGGDFMLFGDNFRYAWVGVNGAIALSKTATDTNDANSNGYYASFDFPDQAVWGKRADTANQSDMPPMFIAPFWADHILGDTLAQYGHIFYGNGGDTCQFIVEWDSIGTFDDLGASADETKFRLILNRCDGTVEFQYDLAGTNGLDTNNLSGMQGDSNFVSGPVPGWVYLNRNGNPPETRIHDGSCVKFYPNISTVALDGWNMVGVSLTPNDANYGKVHLFPQAVSQAFRYSSGYTAMDPLEKGTGVWMKFNGTDGVGANAGTLDQEVTATVQDKWNMVSGPSGIVDIPGDITVIGTTVSSNYFGYGAGGYYTATMIQPGKSYWVKTDGPGTISMNSSGAAPKTVPLATAETDLSKLNRVIISDAYGHSQTLYLGEESQVRNALSFFELPPAPPAGAYDVRYNSQRMLEAYPGTPAEGKTYEYPITIQGAAYPVVIRWEMSTPVNGNRKLVLSDAADGKAIQQVMEGSGYMTIKDASTKSVVIRLSEGTNIPAKFALSQNYPNPFNPVTHFTVDIPQATAVEVAIYDLLGRQIATLLSGTQAPGQYTIEWDGRDGNGMVVPTGMYFVRMSSEQFNSARKIMLMK